jgi:hypothetical protein
MIWSQIATTSAPASADSRSAAPPPTRSCTNRTRSGKPDSWLSAWSLACTARARSGEETGISGAPPAAARCRSSSSLTLRHAG